jgi:hypothetical protein
MSDSQNTLELIRKAEEEYLRASQVAGTGITKEATTAGESAAKSAKLLDLIAGNQRLLADQAGKAALQTQAATDNLLRAGNIDPAMASGTIIDLVQNINTKYKIANVQAQELARAQEVSFLEKPLDWLAAQVTMKDKEDRLRRTLDEVGLSVSHVRDLSGAIGTGAKMAESAKESITASTAVAAAENAEAEWKLRAEEARIKTAGHNIDAWQAAAKIPSDRLSALYQRRSAEMSEQQYIQQLNNFRASEEQRDWARTQKKIEDEAKQVGKQADELIAAKVNKGREVLGMAPLESGEMAAQLELNKRGLAPKLQMLYEIGDRSLQLGTNSLGATPTSALELVRTNNSNLPTDVVETLGLLDAIARQAESEGKYKLIDPKNKQAQDKYINDKISQQFVDYARLIRPNSGNPLDVGDIKNYIGSKDTPYQSGLKELLALPTVQNVLRPFTDSGGTLEDPTKVLDLTFAAVTKGQLTTTQAANDVAKIYQRANILNLQAKNFRGLGISLPKAGLEYVAHVGRGFTSQPVNLADPVAITAYFSRQAAKKTPLDITKSPFGARPLPLN